MCLVQRITDCPDGLRKNGRRIYGRYLCYCQVPMNIPILMACRHLRHLSRQTHYLPFKPNLSQQPLILYVASPSFLIPMPENFESSRMPLCSTTLSHLPLKFELSFLFTLVLEPDHLFTVSTTTLAFSVVSPFLDASSFKSSLTQPLAPCAP